MPAQYSIMVLEIEDSGTAAGSARNATERQLHDAVRSLRGLDGVSWPDALTVDLRDGSMLLALPGTAPARIAGPVVTALDGSLAAHADGGPPVRLHVAIHTGPADGREPGPSADAVSHACLLARAQPLRDTLRASAGARLAVIASDEAYASSIRHDYGTADPGPYLRVRFSAAAGDVTAWVAVPGYPAPPGLRAEPGPPPAAPPLRGAWVDARQVGVYIDGNATVTGDIAGHAIYKRR
jgi:hypothetical protein